MSTRNLSSWRSHGQLHIVNSLYHYITLNRLFLSAGTGGSRTGNLSSTPATTTESRSNPDAVPWSSANPGTRISGSTNVSLTTNGEPPLPIPCSSERQNSTPSKKPMGPNKPSRPKKAYRSSSLANHQTATRARTSTGCCKENKGS